MISQLIKNNTEDLAERAISKGETESRGPFLQKGKKKPS